jgi:hypothetical protein
MERRRNIAQAVILILFLTLAILIGNAIAKGILLFLFSAGMIFNIITILKKKKDDKYIAKVLYGLLLFLTSVLALASVYMVVVTIIETF